MSRTTPSRVRPTDPVGSVMTSGPVTVGPGESLPSVVRGLVADEVGALLVATPRGPVGLLSERDVLAALASRQEYADVQAGEAMTTDLVTVGVDAPVLDAARAMVEAGVRHLPVLDGDRVVGIVSVRDVLAVLVTALET